MPIIPRGQIKSHRMISHWIIAPWIVATTITVVVVALVGVGAYKVLRKPCSGDVTATVVASPDMATVLEGIARAWLEEEPVVGGRCASVEIESKDSASAATALSQEWNTKTEGPYPDAWVPDSSLWVSKVAGEGRSEILPESQPSLGRSAAVIAMPQPMAEALGWPEEEITWTTLVNTIAPEGWEAYGHEEWAFRIVMTDPSTSTAGLLALADIVAPDSTGRPQSQPVATVDQLKASMAFLAETTDQIIAELTTADSQGGDFTFDYLSAFPALEIDVLTFNQGNPTVPLAAVYPSDGTFDADHPYLILSADWVTSDASAVAEAFLEFAQDSENRSAFTEAGFRDDDRSGGDLLSEEEGLVSEITVAAREPVDVETVTTIFDAWSG